jgi:NAD(P)H-dependent FMN reductase
MTRICILSTSPSENARSYKTLRLAESLLAEQPDTEVVFLDLKEMPLPLYPGGAEEPYQQELLSRFQQVDGWIIGGSVYNGGANAHLINFFHYALEPEKCPAGRPFFLVCGAGGGGSAYSFDDIGARIRREVKAVEIGTPVVVTGEPETAKERLANSLRLFIPYAHLYGQLWGK